MTISLISVSAAAIFSTSLAAFAIDLDLDADVGGVGADAGASAGHGSAAAANAAGAMGSQPIVGSSATVLPFDGSPTTAELDLLADQWGVPAATIEILVGLPVVTSDNQVVGTVTRLQGQENTCPLIGVSAAPGFPTSADQFWLASSAGCGTGSPDVVQVSMSQNALLRLIGN